jgi:TolA-binding protein
VELGPKIAPIHYHLGMTYYQLGKKEDAAAALKRSLQIDERFPDAQEARRVLRELGAS